MEDTKERLLRYLNDAWALEKNCVKMIRGSIEGCNDQNVKIMLQEHGDHCHQVEEQLESFIRGLGQEPSGLKGFMSGAVASIADWFRSSGDDYDVTTQAIIKDYVAQASRRASYCSLHSFCQAIGEGRIAPMCQVWMNHCQSLMDRAFSFIPPLAARAVHTTMQYQQPGGMEQAPVQESDIEVGRTYPPGGPV